MGGNPETLTNAAGVVVFEGTTSESGGSPKHDRLAATVDVTGAISGTPSWTRPVFSPTYDELFSLTAPTVPTIIADGLYNFTLLAKALPDTPGTLGTIGDVNYALGGMTTRDSVGDYGVFDQGLPVDTFTISYTGEFVAGDPLTVTVDNGVIGHTTFQLQFDIEQLNA